MSNEAETVGGEKLVAEMACQKAEVNLIRRIDGCTRDLLQSLNSAESLIIGVNKNLLSAKLSVEGKSEKEAREPQGWFERHLAELRSISHKSAKIYDEINRLNNEVKTDKAGQ